MSLFLTERARPKSAAGFTLIEMLVVVAIIALITALAQVSRLQFDRGLFVTNLAYDTALAVREAQVYGADVRNSGGVGASSFAAGYGVYFPGSSGSAATQFVLFTDVNNNHAYDAGDTVLKTYQIQGNDSVTGLCVYTIASPSACTPVSSLTITFHRPDPSACLNGGNVSLSDSVQTSACIAETKNSEAEVTVGASGGNSMTIDVLSNGQISVMPVSQ